MGWSYISFIIEPRVMAANGAAIRNLVESVRPALINNVLRLARGQMNDAITRCHVADELLSLIARFIDMRIRWSKMFAVQSNKHFNQSPCLCLAWFA